MELIYAILLQLGIDLAVENFKIECRKRIDEFGNCIVELYRTVTGSDGAEVQEVLATVDSLIPDIVDGICLVNDGNDIGFGMPELRIVDGFSFGDSLLDDTFTASDDGLLIDHDGDGVVDDFLVPLDYDVTGDGFDDYGLVIDDDGDGLPDCSPDGPFYPIGSDGFNNIAAQRSGAGESIIIMSADGTMSIYDTNGNLTAEDCDTAYSLWVSENGIMNKPLDNYTVTEGLLLIAGIVAAFGFIGKLFRRRRVI